MRWSRAWILFAILWVLHPATIQAGAVGSGPWPMSSELEVLALDHPSLGSRLAEIGPLPANGARLVVFGDQRALADGEWQAMNAMIAAREQSETDLAPLVAIVDTGDIVFDGSHSDQFHMLADILQPLRAYPYLVGVGNHEVHNNAPGPARENLACFLGPSLGDDFTAERLYYARDFAGVRMVFLDTNELVYEPDGEFAATDSLGHRGRAQLRWLVETLAEDESIHTTIAVMHHPLISSSRKHRWQSADLWSLRHEGRTLAQILVEGSVDLVLTGHTHTYERFRITAPNGEGFQLVNVSGRPRAPFLWIGKSRRMARDISGRETDHLDSAGWTDLEGWRIEQLDAMIGSGENQWMELHLLGAGRLEAEVFYLVDRGRGGSRSGGRFTIE